MQFLPDAIAIAEADVSPVGPMGVAVLLAPLWAILPMPSDEALDIWHTAIAPYPADLIKTAVTNLIATRTWDRDPPVPAHIVTALRAETLARSVKLKRLRLLALLAPKPKARQEGTEEDRERLERRMAEFRASACHGKTMPGTTKDSIGRTSAWDGVSDSDIPRLREKALRGLGA